MQRLEERTKEDTRHRWIAVGRSSLDDAWAAGEGAGREALVGDDPRLFIVFCSDRYNLHELLGGITASAPDVPVVGCCTAGEISGSGPGDDGVVVMALGGTGVTVATAAGRADGTSLREASAAAATCVERATGRHRVLLLLTDGLAGDQREVVQGAYQVVGAEVRLVGGCAGDGLKMRETFQVHGTEVLDNAVVAAAICSDAPTGIGVRHGWRRIGDPMLVTAAVATASTNSMPRRPSTSTCSAWVRRPRPAAARPRSPGSRSPIRSGSAGGAAKRSAS